jgi:hypothetical protein
VTVSSDITTARAKEKLTEMNESAAYIISRFFMYAAYATPLISFLIVRKIEKRMLVKIINAAILTTVLDGLSLIIAM